MEKVQGWIEVGQAVSKAAGQQEQLAEADAA